MSGKIVKVAIFGHFGCTNLGNESTLAATLYNFRRLLPNAEFSCICTGSTYVAETYNIKAVPSREVRTTQREARWLPARWVQKLCAGALRELRRWLSGFRTLHGTDALIVAGTGLLTDAYGMFGWGPYDVFRWSVTARLCHCKLLFVSVGAGPIYSPVAKVFVQCALRLAKFRSYRDRTTQRYLTEVGLPASRDAIYPDVVFSLPTSAMRRAGNHGSRPRVVGLGMMLHAGKYSVENPTDTMQASYLETLVTFATWLLENEYTIRLLVGDLVDYPVVDEFKVLLQARGVDCGADRIIDVPITSAADLISQIAATDLVVATRFHNVLLSLLLNKPTVAISFHHKCSSLMDEIGLSEYCLDINNMTSEQLMDQFSRLQRDTDRIKVVLREQVAACQDALETQYQIVAAEILGTEGVYCAVTDTKCFSRADRK